MKIEKFSNVIILHLTKNLSISKFKEGQRKIKKIDYKKYAYDWAINFGLFYIGFSKHKYIKGWTIDFNCNLGLIRIFRK